MITRESVTNSAHGEGVYASACAENMIYSKSLEASREQKHASGFIEQASWSVTNLVGSTEALKGSNFVFVAGSSLCKNGELSSGKDNKNWKKLAHKGSKNDDVEKDATDSVSCLAKKRLLDGAGEGDQKCVILGNVTNSLISAEVAEKTCRTQ